MIFENIDKKFFPQIPDLANGIMMVATIGGVITIFAVENKIKKDLDKTKPDLWDQQCRKCGELIRACMCHPIPCPFCPEEFGFSQDWNIHINEKHIKQMEPYRKFYL